MVGTLEKPKAAAEVTYLDPRLIRRDGGTQSRAAYNVEQMRDYIAAWIKGEAFPPVELFFDGSDYWLHDGFHRTASLLIALEVEEGDLPRPLAELAGLDEARKFEGLFDGDFLERIIELWKDDAGNNIPEKIPCLISQGTQRDAVEASLRANRKNGLPRTDADKRRAVLRALRDEEWSKRSNVAIAKMCAVDESFVRKLKKELLSSDGAKMAERCGCTVEELEAAAAQIKKSSGKVQVERNGSTYTQSTERKNKKAVPLRPMRIGAIARVTEGDWENKYVTVLTDPQQPTVKVASETGAVREIEKGFLAETNIDPWGIPQNFPIQINGYDIQCSFHPHSVKGQHRVDWQAWHLKEDGSKHRILSVDSYPIHISTILETDTPLSRVVALAEGNFVFKVGDRVQIKITKRIGTLKSHSNKSDLWTVVFGDGKEELCKSFEFKLLPEQPDSSPKCKVGDRIEYGGYKGTLTAYDPKTRFWTILFDDGKEELYKSFEFKLLPEQPDSSPKCKVGDRIKYGGHKGTLTAYDPKTRFWTILFDDGKEELYKSFEFKLLPEQPDSSPKCKVGDRIKYGGHKGTLTAYDPKTRFWTILFDDGKEEDTYHEHEFKVLAEQQPEVSSPPAVPQKDNEKERNNAYGLLKMWLRGHYANGLEDAFNAEESTINKIKQHFSEFDPAWQWDENYQAAWNQLKAELPPVPIDNKSVYPYQDPELEQQYIYGLLKMWLRDCYGDSVRQAFDSEQTTINKIKEHLGESDPVWQWDENHQKMWDRLKSEFSQSSKFPITTLEDTIKKAVEEMFGTDFFGSNCETENLATATTFAKQVYLPPQGDLADYKFMEKLVENMIDPVGLKGQIAEAIAVIPSGTLMAETLNDILNLDSSSKGSVAAICFLRDSIMVVFYWGARTKKFADAFRELGAVGLWKSL